LLATAIVPTFFTAAKILSAVPALSQQLDPVLRPCSEDGATPGGLHPQPAHKYQGIIRYLQLSDTPSGFAHTYVLGTELNSRQQQHAHRVNSHASLEHAVCMCTILELQHGGSWGCCR
jgi:hypothetical protein